MITLLKVAAVVAATAAISDYALGNDSFSCRANVALNRVYEVNIDVPTNDVLVINDAGTVISGKASRYVSGRTGDVSWFVATGFGSGVKVQREAGGAGRIALCLAETECYLCR